MEAPEIHKTKDYSIFKFVSFNRDKQKKQIECMKKILQKENLLHFHPIVVNEQMEVIDGQHRLSAAQELGLEIFYVQGNVSYEHILNSNLIQKKLCLADVIKFYALKDKIEDYIKLKKYCDELNVNPKALLGLIFGNCSPYIIDFLKTGKFKFPSSTEVVQNMIDYFRNFMVFVKEKRISPYSMFSNNVFTIAFRNLITIPGFNESVFLSKLQMKWFDLKPQINSKEWTRVLIDIYNWRNQNRLEFNES